VPLLFVSGSSLGALFDSEPKVAFLSDSGYTKAFWPCGLESITDFLNVVGETEMRRRAKNYLFA
jgi:hypothetical protein